MLHGVQQSVFHKMNAEQPLDLLLRFWCYRVESCSGAGSFLHGLSNRFVNFRIAYNLIYADLYDSASFESKKMIVSQLVRRIDVYRGYQIHVDFNFDLAQYLENSDELAC